jgi:hypothetical protein
MKPRIAFILLLSASLVLSTAASVLTSPRYQVDGGTISGGDYRLASADIYLDVVSAGGAYRLYGPSGPSLQVGGCCCTWIPCVLGNP